MRIFVTGSAGFIGYHLSQILLDQGQTVVGIDNLNNYYDLNLKKYRLDQLKEHGNFILIEEDIAEKEKMFKVFEEYRPEVVINLAAQAGVRYSIENPNVYMESNMMGFFNILEACRHYPVDHLIYASSSSVYGANEKVPFEETDFVDKPVSLYAATKMANDLMVHSYNHITDIPASVYL